MASQPATALDWRTVTASDLKSLTFSQLQALSDARKRDMLHARPESPPHFQDVRAAGDNIPVAGPSHTTGRTSKWPSPYARQERSPKSLEVKRYPQRVLRSANQKKKSINATSLESSPEPEEGEGERAAASEDSIKDTIDMMRAMQRENDALQKENEELVQQTNKMRVLAKELQQTLMAERARTDRILTYLQTWQRTSNDWTFESIFPRRDVILMTKTDEEAGTTETIEVDREDAEKIPELKRFFEESIETTGNLTESELQSIPPDVIFELGTRANESDRSSDNDDRSKGKGKAREASFHPRTEQPKGEGSRKRVRIEEDVSDLLNYQVMFEAHQRSKEKHSNESRHFTNLEASGSGSSRGLATSGPSVKRQKVQHIQSLPENRVESNPFENGSYAETTPYSNPLSHGETNSGSGSPKGLASGEPSVKGQKVNGLGPLLEGKVASKPSKNRSRGETTPHSDSLSQGAISATLGEANRHTYAPPLVGGEPAPPLSCSWNRFGRPLVSLPKQSELTITEYVEYIRRGVQFIQAGPPPGFVAEEERRMGQPLRRTYYRSFRWNQDGTPDIDIPICHDPEHVNRLLKAVKFLGTWKSGLEDTPEEEEASEPLEHEDSERTLSVEGLRCSWTASGLPVVTFTTETYDDPQYIDNILLASDFILRGPGPDDKWEGKDGLPDRFRGHLPKDPMVICTYNRIRQPHITLPPPTAPCYYDRIVISAKFIREERKAREKDLASARDAADEIARALADNDDEKLNAPYSRRGVDSQQRQMRVEETVFEERPAEENGEEDAEEKKTKPAKKPTKK